MSSETIETIPEIRLLDLSPSDIAIALRVPPEQVKPLFSDGRTAAAFAPFWARSAFPLTEGLPLYRVLTDGGVNFSQSRSHGVGRTGTTDELYLFLKGFTWVFVTNIVRFPRIKITRLDARTVADWVNNLQFGINGISREVFDRLVMGATVRLTNAHKKTKEAD